MTLKYNAKYSVGLRILVAVNQQFLDFILELKAIKSAAYKASRIVRNLEGGAKRSYLIASCMCLKSFRTSMISCCKVTYAEQIRQELWREVLFPQAILARKFGRWHLCVVIWDEKDPCAANFHPPWLFVGIVSQDRCSRLKSSMLFKCDLALQTIPLSKESFKMQPQLENEDITWSPQYNLHATRTNKCRALSLQEVELDGWFLILHIVLETRSI